MTIPIVSIVGRSDTGKTTLLEKLIKELTEKGYRVGTIKHDVHGFEIDHKGKDSYRHKHAGASLSIISSPQKMAMVRDMDQELNIDDIASRFIHGVDIILTEGYKCNTKPKIEVFRSAVYDDLLCGENDNLIAIATDSRHNINVPQFHIDDATGLAGLIEERFLASRPAQSIRLCVNGRAVLLKPFIANMLYNAVKGMIISLKECADAKEIIISIEDK